MDYTGLVGSKQEEKLRSYFPLFVHRHADSLAHVRPEPKNRNPKTENLETKLCTLHLKNVDPKIKIRQP